MFMLANTFINFYIKFIIILYKKKKGFFNMNINQLIKHIETN